MNNDTIYQRILYDNFWAYLDAGYPAVDTALFRHAAGLLNLAPRLAQEFSLPVETVSHLLKVAIEEVRLSP